MKAPKIIKDIFYIFSANVVVRAIGIIKAVIFPLLLDPQSFGLFRNIQIISDYFQFSHLGVLTGMNIELPYLYGAGNREKANKFESIAFWSALFLSVFIGIVLIIVGYFYPFEDRFQIFYRNGFLLLGLIIVLNQIFTYYNWSLRAQKRFKENSIGMGVKFFFIVFFSIVFIIPLGPIGGVIGICLGNVVVLIYLISIKKPPKFNFNLKLAFKLSMVGLPMVIILTFGILNRTVDQFLILKFFDKKALGYYSFALIMGNLIYFIPSSITNPIFPRMLEAYGKTKKVESLFNYIYFPFFFICMLIPLLIFFLTEIAGLVVKYVLLKYNSSLPLFEILMFYYFFYSFISISNVFLISIKHTKPIIYGLICSSFFNFFLSYFFIQHGFGLNGVAIGTSISFFLYVTYICLSVFKIVKIPFITYSYMYIPFLFTIFFHKIIHAFFSTQNHILDFVIYSFIFILLYFTLLIIFAKKTNLIKGLLKVIEMPGLVHILKKLS